MAKAKLTKAAISFIIEKRNDWNVNYTFADIAHLHIILKLKVSKFAIILNGF